MNIFPKEMEAEEKLYQKLVQKEFPEDRIARQYQLDDYCADIAILPPGLAQEPMAIFEVKMSLQTAMEWLQTSRVCKLREEFSFPIYSYSAEENLLVSIDANGNTKTKTFLPSYDDLQKEWLKRRTFFSELKLKNFMVFKSAEFQFGSKLNVVIGENGAGKSQLLKLLYSIARSLVFLPEKKSVELDFSKLELLKVFKTNAYKDLITFSEKNSAKNANIQFSLSENEKKEEFSLSDDKPIVDIAALQTLNSIRFSKGSAVFLPTHELLSIFPGFNSLGQVYREKWAYDQTYSDCMAYLGLPVIESQAQFASAIIKEVEKAIHGHIYLNEQGTRFLMQAENSKAVYEIPTVAEGWRKFGQLLQLINTGAIHPGSILFWDEPEANLNPQLMCLLAKIIFDLAKMDIQVFITTHSLFFLREIDMLVKAGKQKTRDDVRFFNFIGNGVVEQGDSPEDLGNILLLDESLAQSNRFLNMED